MKIFDRLLSCKCEANFAQRSTKFISYPPTQPKHINNIQNLALIFCVAMSKIIFDIPAMKIIFPSNN